jgi:hypothetical protein
VTRVAASTRVVASTRVQKLLEFFNTRVYALKTTSGRKFSLVA